MAEKTYRCGLEVTMDIIGGKWKGLILWYLSEEGVLRNGEMMRMLPKITQKMLTQQLREMEEDGLIVRKVYEQVPPKVEYSLTAYGEQLRKTLEAMKEWGIGYAKDKHIQIACRGKQS